MREALTWNQAVKMLIEVGRHPALGDPECGPWLEPLRDLDDRRLLTRRSIQRTMSELTLEECVALVRALTVCEESLRWHRGSVSVVLEPQVLLERLVALVPRPRRHLVTYHGVLAPAAGCVRGWCRGGMRTRRRVRGAVTRAARIVR